jgi:excisionase family DNA binding protein
LRRYRRFEKEVITIGQQQAIQAEQKRTYSVAEVMGILGISKKKAYDICKSGCFKSVRIGATIRISKPSFDEWLDKNK